MPALGKFSQQPNEVIDYTIDFGPWVEDRLDSVTSILVTADPGITVNDSLTDNVARCVVSGGVNGERYKVTVAATTVGGLVKEAEFWVKIKEV